MLLRTAGLAALALTAAGCFTYRAPRGVEDAIERKTGVELRHESGFKLGTISTKLATSIVHRYDEDGDFRDLSGFSIEVFQVTKHGDAPTQRITTKDLGVEGWETMFETREKGEQVLVLAKPVRGELREMVFLSIEHDEVVYARFRGHLDRLIAKTVGAAASD